ncbi:MAG: hypothetical protein U1F30_15050 [Steroidobacteraceae bacterium]
MPGIAGVRQPGLRQPGRRLSNVKDTDFSADIQYRIGDLTLV